MDPDAQALADLAQRLREVEEDVSAHDEVVMRLVREWAASLKKVPDRSALATESKRNLGLLERPSPEDGLRLRDLYWRVHSRLLPEESTNFERVRRFAAPTREIVAVFLGLNEEERRAIAYCLTMSDSERAAVSAIDR